MIKNSIQKMKPLTKILPDVDLDVDGLVLSLVLLYGPSFSISQHFFLLLSFTVTVVVVGIDVFWMDVVKTIVVEMVVLESVVLEMDVARMLVVIGMVEVVGIAIEVEVVEVESDDNFVVGASIQLHFAVMFAEAVLSLLFDDDAVVVVVGGNEAEELSGFKASSDFGSSFS